MENRFEALFYTCMLEKGTKMTQVQSSLWKIISRLFEAPAEEVRDITYCSSQSLTTSVSYGCDQDRSVAGKRNK